MQTHERTGCGPITFSFRRRASKSNLHLVAVALFCFANFCGAALDPSEPPGDNFDLSHWHLTLPDDDASTISPSNLTDGYTHSSWFYTGADGAMVFWCPVTGGTTSGSTYPRSELRERIDPSSTSVNWPPWGTHILNAQCKITELPSNGRTVIAQIHSYISPAPALVLIKTIDGVLNAQVRNTVAGSTYTYYPMVNLVLNQMVTYQIKLVNGLLSVTINGVSQSVNIYQADPAWTNQTFYFKAGSYCHDIDGVSSEGSRVSFYQLNVSHGAAPSPPSITAQPANKSANEGATVVFSVATAGTPPLFFQWHKNGAPLAHATNSTLVLTNVSTNDAGSFRVFVSNSEGGVTSAPAILTVFSASQALALAQAVDAPGQLWTATNGTSAWFAQTNVTHDGMDAASSGPLPHSSTTFMQTTVTGPGMVSFWWKVSSEPGNDALLFHTGASERSRVTGETDWQWKTFSVSSGSQALKWTYSKNSSQTGGLDRAWLDQVLFIPDNVPTAPTIAVHPFSTNALAETPVTFNVGAAGSPTLRYQWLRNGINLTNNSSIGIAGATTATLTLSKVQPSEAGLYWVIVTNSAGSVTSSIAMLTVAPIISLADAVDAPNRPWTTNGTPRWIGQTNVSHDGFDAAQSGAIGDDTSTSMQTTVTGPGTIRFWWRVSSEPSNDRLRFYVNGVEQARISGEVNWERRVFNLGNSNQALQWHYSKDDEIAQGQDRGWVDEVEFFPGTNGAPIVVSINLTGERATLSWMSQTGRTYQVMCSDSLPEAVWKALPATPTIIPPVGSVEVGLTNAQRFYRVFEK